MLVLSNSFVKRKALLSESKSSFLFYFDLTMAFITSLYATKSTPAIGQTIQVSSQRIVMKLHPRYTTVATAQ